jgi:uncharacterized membrane protein YeaQ/YmgE (transglycosylase-associated protein family)
LTRHNVGDNGAFLGGFLLTPLPGCGGAEFCWVRLFVCVVFVVVVLASVRDVRLLLLLK